MTARCHGNRRVTQRLGAIHAMWENRYIFP